ncbi:glycosyltransferase [Paracoccus sanguinis]|uniref:Glycosyltransferase n=1 Tax=Paracoccus sanguinis TaxID=1545044 RepID=A0A099GMF6_9RHOB|nr:glycosyltransferase [Paracoccus sanguinis]KGJ23722.1 hypothetical protein IX56_00105 [Paracoccus sanguinis]
MNLTNLKRLVSRSLRGSHAAGSNQPGNIDQAAGRLIVGWVKDAASADPITLDLIVDGVKIAEGIVADEHRQDLEAAGIGSGRFGFNWRIPTDGPGLRAGAIVEAVRAGTREVLLRHVVVSPAPDGLRHHSRQGVRAGEGRWQAKIEHASPNTLRGWAVDRRDRGLVFAIDVLIDGQFYCVARNDEPRGDLMGLGASEGLGGIRVSLPLERLEAGAHSVSLRFPDGETLSEQVVVDESARSYALTEGVLPIAPRDVAVIVPVYNAADDVETCIERLARFTPPEVEVVFIDDASPDPAIAGLMRHAAARPGMRVLTNAQNLGFTRTINRALEEVGRKHAILLNSDARVTPGWVEGMLVAAASRPRVATVTAMSDRAGAFSAPELGNANTLPPGVDEITYARAFRRRSLGLYPVVPTGNGFCMFVNRACIDEIGALDADAFPRGYGEENDFCMRAGRAGWTNLIDDRTYVFHDRSKSFGDAKTELMAAGRAVVDARYPEYGKAIRVFTTGADLNLARFRARQAMADCASARAGLPAVLFVVATQTGGTPQTNLDLMTALADGLDSWLLRCDSRELTLSRLDGTHVREVRRHRLAEPVDPIRHHSGEYDAVVRDWIREIGPEIVHIRHLGWHSLSLPSIAKEQGAAVVFSFHDFYTLCPTVKLLDGDNLFCGGTCTATDKVCRAELWDPDSLPPLKNSWVHVWRRLFDDALRVCDAFVTTSDSARARILTHLPGIDPDRFHVIPHGRSFTEMLQVRRRPERGQPLKILVPGNISVAKGLGVIQALLAHDVAEMLEFHVLGTIDTTQEISCNRLFDHGKYARGAFAARAAEIDAHLGAIFSIWDETYCHTLTELWSIGIPAMVFDFPTVAGRVRESGAGWVLPHDDIAQLYDAILRLAFDPAEQDRADAGVRAWQAGRGPGRTTQLMAARYLDVYRGATGRGDRTPTVAVVAPGEGPLDRANASTEIRLWERTRNSLDRPVNYVRMNWSSLLANVRDGEIDGAIVQRNAVPASVVDSLLAAFARRGIRYAFELDDNLLDVPADKDPDGSYRSYAPFMRKLVENAEFVTVSTAPLRDLIAPINPDVRLLPNLLSEPLWRGDLPPRQADGLVRAVYMGTRTHLADFAMIAPALDRIAARNPDFRLAVIGVHDAPLPHWAERIEILDEAKSYSKFVPWLKSLSGSFDFALAPLEDTAFNRHKSALKVLDGAALGLPVLASDMPVYRDLRNKVFALTLVENSPQAWVAALATAVERAQVGPVDRVAVRKAVLDAFGMSRSLAEFDQEMASLAHPRQGAGGGRVGAAQRKNIERAVTS